MSYRIQVCIKEKTGHQPYIVSVGTLRTYISKQIFAL